MLVLEPDITVNWGSEGVDLHVHTYLYMEATTAPTVRGAPVNREQAIAIYTNVYRKGITRAVTDTSPDVMAVVDAWIEAQDFMALREKEEAIYKQVMEGVHIPDRSPSSGREYVEYLLTIRPPASDMPNNYTASPLYVTLRVSKKGSTIRMHIRTTDWDSDEEKEVMCTLATYPLEPPITMDKVKASVRSVLQAYMDPLHPGWGRLLF